MATISPDSRYATHIAFQDVDTGQLYWSTRVPLSLAPASDDRWVKPRAGERWDAFAYRVYGSTFGTRATRLWWVIADLNAVVNPFLPLDPSTALRCPSATRLVLDVLA